LLESEQTASAEVAVAFVVELAVTGFEVVEEDFSVAVVEALVVLELVTIGFLEVVVASVVAIEVSPGQNPHDLAQF